MADGGNKAMKRYLTPQSPTLASAGRRMVDGFIQRSGDQEFKVRSGGFAGLGEIRQYYLRVRRNVANVKTSSPRKAEVLKALDAYNESMADFEAALRDKSDNQVALLRSASKRSKTAAADLKNVTGRL